MRTQLYALLLEDVRKDAELLQEIITEEGYDIRMDIVKTEQEFVSMLKNNSYDIIYADYTLPDFDGKKALLLAQKLCPQIPFIYVSGTIGEDRAVELVKQGATDYVLKSRMERLAFVTKRALEATIQLKKFRQAEIEQQTNRELLQTIINNAKDIIYIKDIKGRYLLFNQAAERATGKIASEVIGKEDTFCFSTDEARKTMKMDQKVIESGLPYSYEEQFIFNDGNLHTIDTIKCPMFDDNGKPTGLFGISRDITEKKDIEEQLILAKEKAEESSRLKTAFLHNISHEIRTPMNSIVGFADFLNDPDLDAEKRKYFTNIIIQSSNQLLSIVSDIISIATIEAGQAKVVQKRTHVNECLIQLHEQFQRIAGDKDILFELTSLLPDCEALILSDETKILQILSNLIGNALKFTKKGFVRFGCVKKGTFIEFYVEDSGIGISPDMHEEIFNRFRKLENSDMDCFGGFGLGLSISKAYVELLGGKIRVDSDLGKGSTFYFTIPFIKADQMEILSMEWKN